jgi:uncharacterized protein (TIGR02996 family)
MTSDGDALMCAICEQPWEDTPRLIYADWLQENGQPDRAEFIRLQIELEALPMEKRRGSAQFYRAESLHARHERPVPGSGGRAVPAHLKHAWSADLPAGAGVVWGERYARGFQHAVMFADIVAVRAHGAACAAARPVDDVAVIDIEWAEVGELVALPWVARLRVLRLSGNVGIIGAHALARAATLARLEHLDLSRAQVTDAGLRALAAAGLPNLVRLGLDGNPGVTEAGLGALMAPALTKLAGVDGVRPVLWTPPNRSAIHDAFYARFPRSS